MLYLQNYGYQFEKFHGAGNDFIILDNRDSIYSF